MSASRDLAIIFEVDRAFTRLESVVKRKGYVAFQWDYGNGRFVFHLSNDRGIEAVTMVCSSATHIDAIMRWFEILPPIIGYVPPAEIEGV